MLGIELPRVIQEPAVTRVARARMIGIGVIQPLQIPTPVGRELADRIPTGLQQPPELLRRARPTRIPARHPHDRQRLIRPRRPPRCSLRRPLRCPSTSSRSSLATRQRASGGRTPAWPAASEPVRRPAGCAARPRTGSQSPSSLNGAVGVDRLGRGVAEHGRDLCVRTSSSAIASRSASGSPASRRANDEPRRAALTAPAPGPGRSNSAGSTPARAWARSAARSSRIGNSSASSAAGPRRSAPGPARSSQRHRYPSAPAARVSASLSAAGHPGGLGPQAPGERHRGQPVARRAAPARPGTRSPPRSCPARGCRQRRRRREQDELRQVRCPGQLVQVQRRVQLGPQHPLAAAPASATRSRRRPAPRRRGPPPSADARPGPRQQPPRAEPGRPHRTPRPDLAAKLLELGRPAPPHPSAAGPRRLTSSRCRTPCTRARCRASSAAQAAGAAGDQHRPVRVQRLRDPSARPCRCAGASRRNRNASAPARTSQPDRQVLEHAPLEQPQDLGQHLLRAAPDRPPADQRPGRRRRGAQRRPAPDRGCRSCPSRRTARRAAAAPATHRRSRRPARPAPHPRPRRRSPPGTCPVNARSREDAMCASSTPSARSVVPLARVRGREHLGPEVPGQLHRRHPHPAGRRVDQQPLPAPQPRQVDQPVVRGQEHDRHRRRLGERPALRDRHEQPPSATATGPNASGIRPITRSPGRQIGDPGADLEHHAGALNADRRLARIQPQRDQHVPEVQPGRPDRDAHLTRAQRPRSSVRKRTIARPSSDPAARSPAARRAPPAASAQPGPASRRDSRRPAPPAAARPDAGRQRPKSGSSTVVDVDQHEPARVLGLRAAHQPPHRRLRQVRRLLADRDRVRGHHHQPRQPAAHRQPLLHQLQRPPGDRARRRPASPSPPGASTAATTASGTAAPPATARSSAPGPRTARPRAAELTQHRHPRRARPARPAHRHPADLEQRIPPPRPGALELRRSTGRKTSSATLDTSSPSSPAASTRSRGPARRTDPHPQPGRPGAPAARRTSENGSSAGRSAARPSSSRRAAPRRTAPDATRTPPRRAGGLAAAPPRHNTSRRSARPPAAPGTAARTRSRRRPAAHRARPPRPVRAPPAATPPAITARGPAAVPGKPPARVARPPRAARPRRPVSGRE